VGWWVSLALRWKVDRGDVGGLGGRRPAQVATGPEPAGVRSPLWIREGGGRPPTGASEVSPELGDGAADERGNFLGERRLNSKKRGGKGGAWWRWTKKDPGAGGEPPVITNQRVVVGR